MTSTIYLDHAAATPLDERVFAAMEPYLKEHFYNPSSAYTAGRETRRALDAARHRIAMTIGAKKDEIIFTAGATESIHAAFGILAGGGHVLVGATDHAAVHGAAEAYDSDIIPADTYGLLRTELIAPLVRDDTVLISVTYADSELGTIQSLRDIATIVSKIRMERATAGNMTPLYLHTDASQAAMVCDLNVARLGVDMMTLNASKCYGPKQVGLLWVRGNIKLPPLIRGGGQERGIRSGTENVAGAVGFAEALARAQDSRHHEAERLRGLRNLLAAKLRDGLPDMVVNGHAKRQLPSHLHIAVPGLDAERVIFGLDVEGVLVATGAACAANKDTRSPVLAATSMEESLADGSLRLSLGHLNDDSQIEPAADAIVRIVRRELAL